MTKPAKMTAVLLNLALIAIIESTGDYFYSTGLIHAVYVVFALASVYLIFSRYRLYDPILSRLLNFSIIALLIFAVSHTVEFKGFGADAEINLHLAGLVSLIFGAELVMKSYARRSVARLWLWGILAAVFLFLPTILIWKDILLEFYGWTLGIYAAAIAAIEIVLLAYLRRVGKVFSLLHNFSKHIAWASLCIALALAIILLSDVLQSLDVPVHQIEYLTHFSLYAALTFIFTAFLRLSELGGTYTLKDEVIGKNSAL